MNILTKIQVPKNASLLNILCLIVASNKTRCTRFIRRHFGLKKSIMRYNYEYEISLGNMSRFENFWPANMKN